MIYNKKMKLWGDKMYLNAGLCFCTGKPDMFTWERTERAKNTAEKLTNIIDKCTTMLGNIWDFDAKAMRYCCKMLEQFDWQVAHVFGEDDNIVMYNDVENLCFGRTDEVFNFSVDIKVWEHVLLWLEKSKIRKFKVYTDNNEHVVFKSPELIIGFRWQ